MAFTLSAQWPLQAAMPGFIGALTADRYLKELGRASHNAADILCVQLDHLEREDCNARIL